MRVLCLLFGAVTTIGLGIVSCSSTSGSSGNSGANGTGGTTSASCLPGEQSTCTCTGADTGIQVCNDLGVFDTCVCDEPDASTGDAGDAGVTDAGVTDADVTDADVTDADAPDASGPSFGPPTVVVPNLAGVRDLVVFTNNVFWASEAGGGTVSQCPISGCGTPTMLASAQAFPRSLAVTSGIVIWAVYQTAATDGGYGLGSLRTTPAGSPGFTIYLDSQAHPAAVVADSNLVYWSVDFGIYQCALFGCATPLLLTADVAQAMAVGADTVYYATADGNVSSVPIGGGAPATIASNASNIHGLELAGGEIFWATATSVSKCSVAGAAAPTSLAAGQNIKALRHPLAADTTHVYWSSDSSVVRCPLAGCPPGGPELVAADQTEPTSVAVDATNIYWVDGDAIKKAAKPQ